MAAKNLHTRESAPTDRQRIELTEAESVRFVAALRGEDGWRPNQYLVRSAELFKKAVAEGRLKVR